MKSCKNNSAHTRNQRGAAVIEFAIVLPLLLAILFGTLEFCFFFLQHHYVVNSAREGVRIGVRAQNYNCFSNPTGTGDVCRKESIAKYLSDCSTNPKGYLCTLYEREIAEGKVKIDIPQPPDGETKTLSVTVTAPNFFPQLISWIVPIYKYPESFTYTSSGNYENPSEL